METDNIVGHLLGTLGICWPYAMIERELDGSQGKMTIYHLHK